MSNLQEIDEYIKFTGPAELHKAINTLKGIANFSYKNGPILSFNTKPGPKSNTTIKAINTPMILNKLKTISVLDLFHFLLINGCAAPINIKINT